MQNNPSRPTVYDIDAALEAIEEDNRRQEEALRAFYARRSESRPMVRITLNVVLMLLATALGIGLLAVWLVQKASELLSF